MKSQPEKNIPVTLIIAAVLAAGIGQGFALTQFKDGGTHNIISTINDDVWVDFQTPGLGTTANVLAGGSIFFPYFLQGFNDSKLNILDGYVYRLQGFNDSKLNIFGGYVHELFAVSGRIKLTHLGSVQTDPPLAAIV